jgi:hypothetical protein
MVSRTMRRNAAGMGTSLYCPLAGWGVILVKAGATVRPIQSTVRLTQY